MWNDIRINLYSNAKMHIYFKSKPVPLKIYVDKAYFG